VAKVRVGADEWEVAEGQSLLQVLQSNGYPIATSCGGVASCGLCRLTVVRGGEALSPLKSQEIMHLGNVAKIVGLRLACQARIAGEATIELDVPVVDDVETRKRRKAERLRRREGPPSSAGALRDKGTRVEWRPRLLAKRNNST
jgi:ferredoxin